ncbi:serine protease [Halalkalibacillus sediminis]|uniref:Serine protease n=1 Tax=Halalkalibacillus sediminis TaxID=2018042 RepID=A0A2I0QVT7_9BACI|nr:trypsin-like peptidase domain-containing protein [Halalkalibacillus sediminis]PKR78452.1 serine protease [Halalkalibacillus sediminis]
MNRKKRMILPLTISALIILLSISGLFYFYNDSREEAIGSDQSIVEVVQDDQVDNQQDFQSIIHESQKYVVQIESHGSFGKNEGSGFIYNEKGDIITNAHVVKDADEIFVKTSEAQTYPAAVIGIGNQEDVAVIRVPQLANKNPMEMDDTFEPNIGDEIIAIGSPHGFQNTVTRGIISGKNRSFTVDNYEYNNLYQISANISQGNSGGPLIHRDTGQVIAINSAATTEGTIGFSLPIPQIYEQVHMWSEKADNEDELDYNGDPTVDQDISPEKLEEDASYIINYFYETLNLRDYFTAYSLLGSEEQTKNSYEQFREVVVNSIDINVSEREIEIIENDRAKVIVYSDHEIRKNTESYETHHYKTDYVIGYENDQLKILSLDRELLSKTEHQTDEEEE